MNIDFKKIIEKYGVKNQIEMAKEELAELIVALSHKERGRIPLEYVIEEIADVTIMLEQLKVIYDVDLKYLQTIINAKLCRLEKDVDHFAK
jgi:NTP pyrophosphatase (non-canonical NTP hydrolase)